MLKIHAFAISLCCLWLIPGLLNAQQDTEFWFAAPEILQATQGLENADRPALLRVFTSGSPASIKVWEPINDTFPVLTINLAAYDNATLDLTPWLEYVETRHNNLAFKRGLLIQSSAPITAYYEVLGETQTSPEIFSLKGRSALGKEFYLPFQNFLDNPMTFPQPHSGFVIVATEDNTTITTTPTNWFVDHPSNITFDVSLNRGETFYLQTASQPASAQPGGTHVTADKPIAITVKDDLLEGGELYGGSCLDGGGDQLVPVEQLGTEYVVQKGFLTGTEYTFIVATGAGTIVQFDGLPQGGPLDAGETLALAIEAGSHLIQSSQPVYAWQVTGNGCNLGGALVPPLPPAVGGCSGPGEASFLRTNTAPLYLFLTTASGNENSFTLNGTPLPAGGFQPVPGSNGAYVAASVPISLNLLGESQLAHVTNTAGVFQMGVLSGGDLGIGASFAYLSDADGIVYVQENVQFCPGTSVALHGLSIDTVGVFTAYSDNAQGCDTIFQITAGLLPQPEWTDTLALCPDQSFVIGGQSHFAPGVVETVFLGQNGACDTLATYVLLAAEQPLRFDTLTLCTGDSVLIDGQLYDQPGTYVDTIASTTSGCDTLAYYTLDLPAADFIFNFGGLSCAGDSLKINYLLCNFGSTPLPASVPVAFYDANPTSGPATLLGIYQIDTQSDNGCVFGSFKAGLFPNGIGGPVKIFSVVNLAVNLPTPFSPDELASSGFHECTYRNNLDSTTFAPPAAPVLNLGEDFGLCAGPFSTLYAGDGFASYFWDDGSSGPYRNVFFPGTYWVEATDACGGKQRDTVVVTLLPPPTVTRVIEFCPGEQVTLFMQPYSQPDTLVIPIATGGDDCDTLATYILKYPDLLPGVLNLDCPANLAVNLPAGSSTMPVSFSAATATSDCTCPGIGIMQTGGPASGSAFATGIHQVCFSAADSCGATATCCFTITVNSVETACDTKVAGCVKYELLGVSLDPGQNRTYRIRVTNNCADKLAYAAFQVPDGVAGLAPANNSIYTSPGGRDYAVRNPNFSPFYSVRFKPVVDSLATGQSDVFSYQLPAQSNPVFLHVLARLASGLQYETHLNTFACAPTQSVSFDPNIVSSQRQNSAQIFPNPTDGTLWINLREESGRAVQLRVLNAQGSLVQEQSVQRANAQETLALQPELPAGLYFLEILPENGKRTTLRFLLHH